MMVLKVVGEDTERNVDRDNKVFVWMGYGWFLGSSSIDEILIEVFQLKDQGLGSIGDIFNEKWKSLSDVRDNGFKRLGGVNWSVGSVRDWSVVGDSKKGVVGYWA